MKERIEAVWKDRSKGRGIAGYRKTLVYLRRDGVEVGIRTVQRLMREIGLKGVIRGGWKPVTTRADQSASRPAGPGEPGLHGRASESTVAGRLHLCADLAGDGVHRGSGVDACSHRIVGRGHDRPDAGRAALGAPRGMALWVRSDQGWPVAGVTHHSDAGSRYTSVCYRRRSGGGRGVGFGRRRGRLV
ncbi:MAG: IS3 family transposase [Propionibacteriaceae bacterium]|nr:IS3 family transposase [Propionibacteriaceae bacterium]